MTDESTTPTQPETPTTSDASAADLGDTATTETPTAAVEVSDAPPAAPAAPGVSIENPFNLVLTAICIAGVVLGLLLGGEKLWDVMGWTWAILAIVAAVATAIPSFSSVIGLSEKIGNDIQSIAVAFLGLWWVLFVMPRIQTDQAFLATIGVFAAGALVWRSRSTADVAED